MYSLFEKKIMKNIGHRRHSKIVTTANVRNKQNRLIKENT